MPKTPPITAVAHVRLAHDLAPVETIVVTVEDAARISGHSRSALYQHLEAGRLEAVKAGARTLILLDSLRALIAGMPRYAPIRRTAAATEARKRHRAAAAVTGGLS